MDDVAPELYESIKKQIDRGIASDSKIQTIMKRIAKGTATHKDTQEYALRLGKLTSKALQNNLTEAALPGGNLSYHIAQGTVGKTLRDNLDRVNGVGCQIQNSLNSRAGIGLRAVEAQLNSDRVHGLVSNMDNCDELERARELMLEPVVNTTQSYADDLIKENADAQYNAGMQPVIRRTAEAGCCDWCMELEGTFNYPVSNEDVYRRHEYCRCVVTYDPKDSRGTQNVHTKKWTTPASTIAERKTHGL